MPETRSCGGRAAQPGHIAKSYTIAFRRKHSAAIHGVFGNSADSPVSLVYALEHG